MRAYKNVYRLENGILIKNKENKISYVDSQGIKRTKTNPTYKDFARANMYPVKYLNEKPEHDPEKERVEEEIRVANGYFEITYTVKEVI